MLLGSEKLKLAFITTHIPLQKVSNAINENAVFSKTKILDIELKKKFKIKNPRIGILGLNPHAGENGKIGSEEINKIAPAIKKLKSQKINITGPISADTAFTASNRKKYDAFVAMYHDQALPVLKAISFGSGYNITLGVSIIRTSVDHGVALDIAGKDGLDYGSLQSAINLAQKNNLMINRAKRRKFGQNYLKDKLVLAKMSDYINPKKLITLLKLVLVKAH